MQQNQRIKPGTCARELGIERSTLKRYLENYRELLDDNGRVDLDEVRRHRADNPAVASASEAAPKEARAPASEPDTGSSRRGSKHRLDEIKAWDAEREWAKSIGQLVDPTEILDALSEAAVALRDKFMAPDPVLCERIAGESDVRAVMTLLRENSRALLDEFSATMRKIAGESAAPIETPPIAAATEAAPAEPDKAEPDKAEPDKAEPDHAGAS